MTTSNPSPSAPTAVRLGPGTRVAMRARHGVRLARDLTAYAVEQRLWWLLPMVVVLVVVALAVTTAHTVVPVAVYTLF